MPALASNLGLYLLAALAEIIGCYAFWAWLRLGKSWMLAAGGVAFLALFAFLLTRIELDFAGRAYAAYGGVYIVASVGWLWAFERQAPSWWDLAGAGFCLVGVLLFLVGPALAK